MRFLRSFLLMAALFASPALGLGDEDLLSPVGDFPSIDTGAQGGFVSVWTETLGSGEEIFASLVPPGGGEPGPPFQVNARATGPQLAPDVAVSPQGNFMVVWQGGTFSDPSGGDGDQEGVFGQVFTRDGVRVGPERRLSENITAPQLHPRVSALENGVFAAVWEDQSTFRFEIILRLFSASGEPLGPEKRLSVAGEYNLNPRIAVYARGFAVSWAEGAECSGGRPDTRRAVIARFDLSGLRTGKLIRIGRLVCSEVTAIEALAGSRAGAVAILRTSGGHSVQRLGPSGEILGKPVAITRRLCAGGGLGAFCRFVRNASMDDQGRFALVWEVVADPTIFYAQLYKPNLTSTGSVELGFRGGAASSPAIALGPGATVGVVLRKDGGLPEEAGLFLQRFRSR